VLVEILTAVTVKPCSPVDVIDIRINMLPTSAESNGKINNQPASRAEICS
jgi:hypothetical protein